MTTQQQIDPKFAHTNKNTNEKKWCCSKQRNRKKWQRKDLLKETFNFNFFARFLKQQSNQSDNFTGKMNRKRWKHEEPEYFFLK